MLDLRPVMGWHPRHPITPCVKLFYFTRSFVVPTFKNQPEFTDPDVRAKTIDITTLHVTVVVSHQGRPKITKCVAGRKPLRLDLYEVRGNEAHKSHSCVSACH